MYARIFTNPEPAVRRYAHQQMLAMQAAAHDNVIKLVNVIENSHQVVIMYEMWVVCLFFAQENNNKLVKWQMTFFLRLHGEEPLKFYSLYVKAIAINGLIFTLQQNSRWSYNFLYFLKENFAILRFHLLIVIL